MRTVKTPKKQKADKVQKVRGTEWNFKLFYSSLSDPQIEKDIFDLEKLCQDFSKNYSEYDGSVLTEEPILKSALEDFFSIKGKLPAKPLIYLTLLTHKDSSNTKAQALLNLFDDRVTKAINKLTFFRITLGKISIKRQTEILYNKTFEAYSFFLSNIFADAHHMLSESEEKILNLKDLPASTMWNTSHERILSTITVQWKGQTIPLTAANGLVNGLPRNDRLKLSFLISSALKKISIFSEAEINAVVTDKKINDELKGYKTPYENTIRRYRNDPETVTSLVDIVTKNFPISHKFFKIKAGLLKLKRLAYSDRAAQYGKITGDFSFTTSKDKLLKVFGDFDIKYKEIFEGMLKKGQIDVYPQKGKHGGAYCWGTFGNPTFVLLNHSNNLRSYETLAHEMGHAFHSQLSKSQGPVYCGYSTSTAETASTFFEALAFDAFVETLAPTEKIIALHNKINSDISTIFRQIACFNYEKDIHTSVRKNGFISKEELADLHNKHMKAYLGPLFDIDHDSGYSFVQWSHIRNFFYVYTYAFGLLVSKVLLKKYRQDPSFISSIEKFLLAGGKDTPENILKEIGIDVTSGKLFEEGIKEIEKDIRKLEEMLKKSKK